MVLVVDDATTPFLSPALFRVYYVACSCCCPSFRVLALLLVKILKNLALLQLVQQIENLIFFCQLMDVMGKEMDPRAPKAR